MKKCIHIVRLVAVLSIAVCMVGCRNSTESATTPTNEPKTNTQSVEVHVATLGKALDYGPYYVAKSKGLLEKGAQDAGTKATFANQEFQALPPLNDALAAGKVDLVLAAEIPLLVGRSSGINTKLIKQICTLRVDLMVPSNSPVKQVSQLKGKRIAVLFGSGTHYGLLEILKKAGLDKSDVKLLDMSPPDAKSAFETGQVDAWMIWSPFPEELILAGKARLLPDAASQVQVLLAARKEFIDSHRDILASVVKTLDENGTWIRSNPSEAKSLLAKDLSLDPKVIEMAWPKENWAATLDPSVLRDIQNKADFLSGNKMTSKKVDVMQDFVEKISLK